MAVLQKIRVKFGLVISIIIALALLSFIIDPNTLQTALGAMSSKYDVGSIAGKRISYTDYQENVDKFTTIYQVATGSSTQNEQTQQQIRDAAWQDLLNRHMFLEYAKDAGVRVGEAEIVELTTGSNISPVLAQNPAFADETGMYSAEALRDFVQNLDSDQTGKLRTYWNYLQNAVYVDRFFSKYNALFAGASFVPQLMVDRRVAEANTSGNVDYVALNPNYADTTVNVAAKDVKAYYNSHKKEFKQPAGRDIDYVVFEVIPSEADITATIDQVDALLPEFDATTNMRAFLLRNSERQYSEYWYGKGGLRTISADVDNFVWEQGGKGVSPVFRSGDTFRSVKVMAEDMIPDSVYVKHILIQGTDARHTADSLCGVVAKGGNLSTLAAAYSVDQNSMADGELGSLGWFTQNYLIPGFEPAFTAQVGKPFVLDTQYGSHVVLVSKRTKPVAKKQVAILEKTSIAGKETFNNFYNQANRFASIANGTLEGYRRAVDSTGVYSHRQDNVTEATANYGSVNQAKEITRWVYDAKKGDASNIITVNNNFFFVVALRDVRKEGTKSLEDAASSISMKLRNEKLLAKAGEEAAAKIAGVQTKEDLEAALGKTAQSAEVSFYTPGFGSAVEPALVGASSVAPVGQVGGPVIGNAAYLFIPGERTVGSFFTEEDARNSFDQENSYLSRMVTSVMMEDANVKDNRARFF